MNKPTLSSLVFVSLSTLTLVACDSSPSGSQATSKASAATAGETSGATKAAVAPAAKAAKMVEYDLSPAHAVWKGWVAKGPEGAKVMADGVNGARIAGKGPSLLDRKKGGDNGFDITFTPKKKDLKGLKASLEKGAANPEAKLTLSFSKDEADMLEWTAEVAGLETYNFVMHLKVDGKDFSCGNNYMIGAGNQAEHQRQLDACKTLKKK